MASAPGLLFGLCSLFLALFYSSTGFQGTDAKCFANITSSLQVDAFFGECIRVQCEGRSAFQSGSIYWLANSSFVEDLYPYGAVSEEEARETSTGDCLHLSRELVFRALSKRDLQTTFRCVILDPAGATQKTLTWQKPEEEGCRDGESGSGMSERP